MSDISDSLNEAIQEFSDKIGNLINDGKIIGAACVVSVFINPDGRELRSGHMGFTNGELNPDSCAAALGTGLVHIVSDIKAKGRLIEWN